MKRKPWPLVIEERDIIRGAGGVVSRFKDGNLEVLFIYRTKHKDWSLPKGRLEPNEPAYKTALREVFEETSVLCALGDELPTVRYIDRNKRPKEVRFWRMSIDEELPFKTNDEVAEIRWLQLKEGLEILTYNTDRILLKRAFESRKSEFFSNTSPGLNRESRFRTALHSVLNNHAETFRKLAESENDKENSQD